MKRKSRTPRVVAMDYLARREHTRIELERKLAQKGFEPHDISAALDKLRAQNLQSDQRFAEHYAAHRARNGQGAFKIRLELKARGVDDDLMEATMSALDVDWKALAQAVWDKKFGVSPQDLTEKAKQQRFMAQRGFEW
ncbi:MAG: hypothetical protein COB66_06015 [Coxiella sp. (in: Bacteria)]|nr:MAG: hypothetical protein COB66_06015 [Coxiella sp. (in: g-proteobacteria)]